MFFFFVARWVTFFFSLTLLITTYALVWASILNIYKNHKIVESALLKFLRIDEWNGSHALLVLSESIEFVAHREGEKVELE